MVDATETARARVPALRAGGRHGRRATRRDEAAARASIEPDARAAPAAPVLVLLLTRGWRDSAPRKST